MNKTSKLRLAHAASLLIAFSAGVTQAATLEDFGLSGEESALIQGKLRSPSASPGIAFGSPIGFGTGYTEFFAGVGGQTMPDTAPDSVDGSASAGVGIGNPFKWLAVEVSTTIISLQDSFGSDGNLNAKLHYVLPGRIGVAVGVENAAPWGDADGTDPSYYFAATKSFDVFPAHLSTPLRLSLNAGVGDNRFAKPEDPDSIGGFGSVALSYNQRISLIADWTGRDANAGISMLPFGGIPLVLTVGVINLTERYGVETQFAGGIGYTFRL